VIKIHNAVEKGYYLNWIGVWFMDFFSFFQKASIGAIGINTRDHRKRWEVRDVTLCWFSLFMQYISIVNLFIYLQFTSGK